MRTLFFSCLLACVGLGGTIVGDLQAQSSSELPPQLAHILEEQAAAWNRGDAAAWAAAFTDDADFVNIRGQVFAGRAAVAAQHARIFAGPFKGSHITITIRRSSEPAPGLALIETDQTVTHFAFLPPGIAPTAEGSLLTHMKYVAMARDGAWHLIAAQNTAALPEAAPPR